MDTDLHPRYLNVFILSTGRCGSRTFSKACAHIANYTSAHESKKGEIGAERLNFPDNHIEADNRLTWFLGRLDEKYGTKAFYVHLQRNREETVKSIEKRYFNGSILKAYAHGILIYPSPKISRYEFSLDYYETVNSNIRSFLKDKPHQMTFNLENAREDFRKFWDFIGAQGSLAQALDEWNQRYNITKKKNLFQRLFGRRDRA